MFQKSQRMRSQWEIIMDILSATAKNKNTKRHVSCRVPIYNGKSGSILCGNFQLVEKMNSDEDI